MGEFTPGPWHCADKFIISEDDAYICEINFPLDDSEIGANARLIAAAPDLLEALETIMGDSEHGQGMIWSDRCKMVREAIAKATGK